MKKKMFRLIFLMMFCAPLFVNAEIIHTEDSTYVINYAGYGEHVTLTCKSGVEVIYIGYTDDDKMIVADKGNSYEPYYKYYDNGACISLTKQQVYDYLNQGKHIHVYDSDTGEFLNVKENFFVDTYIKTTDTTVQESKTYYIQSGDSPDYEYSEVENPVVSEITNYYETIKLVHNDKITIDSNKTYYYYNYTDAATIINPNDNLEHYNENYYRFFLKAPSDFQETVRLSVVPLDNDRMDELQTKFTNGLGKDNPSISRSIDYRGDKIIITFRNECSGEEDCTFPRIVYDSNFNVIDIPGIKDIEYSNGLYFTQESSSGKMLIYDEEFRLIRKSPLSVNMLSNSYESFGNYIFAKNDTVGAYELLITKYENKNETVQKFEKSPLTFTFTGQYEEFTGVEVDGVKLSTNDFTVKKGSTIITLSTNYLSKLKSGNHTIKVLYGEDIYSTATFTTNVATNPDTVDNIILYSIIGVIAVLGITVSYIYLKKKTVKQ